MARAATIPGHRVRQVFVQHVRRLGVARRMLTETEPFLMASTIADVSSRTAVPLRAHDEVLGSIWAITPDPLDDERTARCNTWKPVTALTPGSG